MSPYDVKEARFTEPLHKPEDDMEEQMALQAAEAEEAGSQGEAGDGEEMSGGSDLTLF